MKVISVVPVHGRETLLKHTISRLAGQCYKVVTIGQTQTECDTCEAAGADFYYCHKGMFLGHKWQTAVDFARDYSPDAILIMGSAGMISDNWIETLAPDLDDYSMTGSPGIHFLHYERDKMKMAYWKGYMSGRSNEPVGVGRLVSRKFLEKSNWKLFNKTLNSGCDYSTIEIIKEFGGSVNINRSTEISSLRISSNKWKNKNGFYKMARFPETTLLSDFSILDNFPETKTMKL